MVSTRNQAEIQTLSDSEKRKSRHRNSGEKYFCFKLIRCLHLTFVQIIFRSNLNKQSDQNGEPKGVQLTRNGRFGTQFVCLFE